MNLMPWTVQTACALLPLIFVPPDGAWRHDRDEARFRALGSDPAFAAVGRIEGRGKHLGSAVLIAKRWVLTDAHVVSTRSNGATHSVEPEELTVSIGDETLGVRAVMIHPGYWPQGVAETEDVLARKGIDVALLELAAPVTDVRPATLVERPVAPGSEVTFVGFGTAGTSQSVVTDPLPAGTKRAGTNVIDQIGGMVGSRRIPPFLLVCDFDAPGVPSLSRTGETTPSELEYLPVGGDSGGAAFVRVGERWMLAGLIATASVNIPDDPDLGIYGSLMYATAVEAFRAFVDDRVPPP